jgi:tRNA(Ile)-lysidine synthase TilS/MesJ
VIGFGHNADDLAQTTLLNVIYQGRAETMLPTQNYFDGALRVIRPLYNTPEIDLLEFSKIHNFPPPPPPCPQSEDSKRLYASQLMEQLKQVYPPVRQNLLSAGLRGIYEEDK